LAAYVKGEDAVEDAPSAEALAQPNPAPEAPQVVMDDELRELFEPSEAELRLMDSSTRAWQPSVAAVFVWKREDANAIRFRTSLEHGPKWETGVLRRTLDAHSGAWIEELHNPTESDQGKNLW